MDHFCLKDVWRIQNETRREYSWRKKGEGHEDKASRIDMALVTAGLDQKVKHVTYLSSVKTDHRALYMVLELTDFKEELAIGNSTIACFKRKILLTR